MRIYILGTFILIMLFNVVGLIGDYWFTRCHFCSVKFVVHGLLISTPAGRKLVNVFKGDFVDGS